MAYNFNQQYLVDPITGEPIYQQTQQATSPNPLTNMMNTGVPMPTIRGAGSGIAYGGRAADVVTVPQGAGNVAAGEEEMLPGWGNIPAGKTTGEDATTKSPAKKGGGASLGSWGAAAGSVLGDVTALSQSTGKYDAGQKGKTIVGGVGTVVGGIFGMPELGGAIGSFIGGTVGGAFDKKHMREDYDETTNRHFGQLRLQPNINPYGNYMREGGMVSNTTLAPGDSMLDSFLAKLEKQETDSMQDVDMDDPVSAAFARCGIYMKRSKRYADGGVTGGPGPKPIYTSNRNDPRLRMYSDSLLLHNQGNRAAKDLNKRMFSNAISNTEYLRWYAQNNDPKVEAAAARLTKANKQKPQPSGTTTPVDVYKNSSVIGQAATNLYTKPVQPVIYQPEQSEPTYADSLALYNKAKGIQKRYDSYLGTWDLPPFVAEGRMLERDNPRIKPIGYQSYQARNQMGDIRNIPFSHGSDNNHLFDTPIYKKPVGTPKPPARRRVAAADLIDQDIEVNPQMMSRRSPTVNVNKPIVTNYSYAYRNPEGGQSVQYFPDHASWQEFMKDKTYTSQTVTADKSRASASGYEKGGIVNDQNEPDMEDIPYMKKGGKHWIQKAVNPKHKGYCTPMTKSTCTPRRKALARTFKKHHGFHKKEDGGVTMRNPIEDIMYEDMPNVSAGYHMMPDGTLMRDDAMYMQEGGETAMAEASAAPAPQEQQGPQKTMINIEKGEILIDPMLPDLPVIREYENPNRYMAHKKDPMKEPIGNFTMVEEGKVVIPKSYASRYKRGDILTRKSIIGEILKDQMNNPEQNDPRGTTEAKYAQAGVVNFNPPGRERKGRAQQWDWLTQLPQAYNTQPDPRYPYASIVDPAANTGAKFGDPSANTPVDYTNYDDNLVTSKVKFDPAAAAVAKTTAPGKKSNPNLALIGAKIASAIPTAYGITNALGYDPYLKYDENYGYQDALAMAEGMETNPNMEASRAALNQALVTQNRVLNNIGSPSVRAEAGVNRANLLKAFGEQAQAGSNLAMELREKKRGTIMNLKVAQGQNRLDMRQQLMNELRMDDANRQSLVHQGLSEGATNYQQSVMDEERIKAINTIAQYYKLDPYNAELLLDQQLFMPHVTESLSYLSGTPGRRAAAATNAAKKTANSKG
jgi:hypothetical protein